AARHWRGGRDRKGRVEHAMSSVRIYSSRFQENRSAGLQQLLRRIRGRLEFAFESNAQRHCACRQVAGACPKNAGVKRSHENADRKSAQGGAGRELRNGG